MRPVFHPRLVNGPFEDPALFIPLTFSKQALLFDLGDLRPLAPRDILKLSHIFVSHTHIDHFIGFDQVLRLLLGRGKTLHLYGPQGFLDNLNGKLRGYTWNLVDNYAEALVINATEISRHRRRSQSFDCRSSFTPSPVQIQDTDDGVIHHQPEFKVTAAVLDHRTPCLGFCVHERFHINIMKAALATQGIGVGPWLSVFKRLLYSGADPLTEIQVPMGESSTTVRGFQLGELAARIARITPGQKMAYITDVVYSSANEKKMTDLARDADHLFIEAVFLDHEKDIARDKYHLTAKQAGLIAHKAQVKQMTLFHHSPRHLDQTDLFIQEAQQAFREGK